MNEQHKTKFEEAGEQEQLSLLGEFWQMLKQNKKYWLIPLIVGLLLFGLLIILGSSVAAPFIYTLF
jgi:uncharacterized protein DUF5989